MAANENTRDVTVPVLEHVWKIQAALTGAAELFENICPDDNEGKYWSARELVRLALDEAGQIYPSVENMKAALTNNEGAPA